MRTIIELMNEMAGFPALKTDLKKGNTPLMAEGCVDDMKCHLTAAAGESFSRKLIVAATEARAREIEEDYRFFDREICYYPAKDAIFFEADVHSSLIMSQRMKVVDKLLDGEAVTVVTSAGALLDRILPLETLRASCLDLRAGEELQIDRFAAQMVAMGYARTLEVEQPGQFSVRGGIIDFFNLCDRAPVRIELWGDEIDSIRVFDAESQRTVEMLDETRVYPASEYILESGDLERGVRRIRQSLQKRVSQLEKEGRQEIAAKLKYIVEEFCEDALLGQTEVNIDSYLAFFLDRTVTLADYFSGPDSLIIFDEPARIEEEAGAIYQMSMQSMQERYQGGRILPEQTQPLCDDAGIMKKISDMHLLLLATIPSTLQNIPIKKHFSVTANSIRSYRGNFSLLVKDLERWKRQKYRIIIVSRSALRAGQLVKDLEEREIYAFSTQDEEHSVLPGQIMIISGNFRRGIEYPSLHFVILSENDMFGDGKRKKTGNRKKRDPAADLRKLSDLHVGDYVVHEDIGIGIYRGIEQVEIDDVESDYIRIEYAGGSDYYISVTGLDKIQKYADAETQKVKLNRIGGAEWQRTKSRVRKEMQLVASDLVELYAARQSKKGYACGPDTVWQTEFEDLFPYEETSDQLSAIESVKQDMESSRIMDRLICGDVGFGKTEIAIRAAFKIVQEGKQCAMLVPTTILAQQHYTTFMQRMEGYPIDVGIVSRFCTPTQIKKTLADLKAGRLDIIIGTHRLLSKDVQFKDLGLLVIDEEQRFGVRQKEKIKQLRETVDVITLTATPIPRTMHMSLIGVRDVSILDEPPAERLPIQTYIIEENDDVVRDAIRRELHRGGQVFYVYNRVRGIEDAAARIGALVPEAEVAFAHGQMGERALEKVMYSFVNGEIDVLISTTIIETGLDIINANTLIIHDADKFGLAQLYQLRGRVGRSSRTAYAYLLFRRDKVLSDVARKRLSAIREFTQLGSGYRIAMRDLQIRGAGSLLGEYQSGNIGEVGYDLYCKMLGEAVAQAKGETLPQRSETVMDLDIDAFLPAEYIQSENQKLDMYKRIASIQNEEEYEDVVEELLDRFGEIPSSAMNLLRIVKLKLKAGTIDASMVSLKENVLQVYVSSRAGIDTDAIPEVVKKLGMKLGFSGKTPYFEKKLSFHQDEKRLKQTEQMLDEMIQILSTDHKVRD